MNDTDFLELAMRHQDGALSAAETSAFEAVMQADPAKRKLFTEAQLRSMTLHDRFRQEAFRLALHDKQRRAWLTRPVPAMAAGLVCGLFCASLVWAVAAPIVTSERLHALIDGGFEHSQVEAGFPARTGVWSGDAVEISAGDAGQGGRQLRFISPQPDAANPKGRAISCDVFQLVDLRPLRPALSKDGDTVLELSGCAPPKHSPFGDVLLQNLCLQRRSLQASRDLVAQYYRRSGQRDCGSDHTRGQHAGMENGNDKVSGQCGSGFRCDPARGTAQPASGKTGIHLCG